jgi:DNA-binding IclR family transcriptional regulator
VNKPLKAPPPYAVASVDHALRAAAMLQLEDGLTVSQVAERLGVARSTAHRLLAMLVYRDFAVQDEERVYRASPVLELASHSPSVAVGVVVRGADGTAQAGLSVSMPSVRYDPHQLPSLVATLAAAARRLEAELGPPSGK